MEIFTLCLLTTKFLAYLKKKGTTNSLVSLIFSWSLFLCKPLLHIPSLCWRYSTARFLIYSYMIAQRSTASIFPEASTKLAERISPQMLKTSLPCNFQECDDLLGPLVYPHPQTDTEQKEYKNILMGGKKYEVDLLFFLSLPCHVLCSPPLQSPSHSYHSVVIPLFPW